MNIDERPHYEIMSTELADWLDRQGDHWWSVTGDWFLGGRISMPCPGDELAWALIGESRWMICLVRPNGALKRRHPRMA